jgi:Asp-tRNA(Asn)/Glu-tRNA(Gln) amidotransferase A subunit family amidase
MCGITEVMQYPPGLAEAAAAIQRKMISPLELVEDCLGRIDRWEPRLGAWVTVDRDGALETARRLTDELARGTTRGPLHGIPLAIKDIVDVAGFPTRAGSNLTDSHPAAEDAQVVALLRRAGAIILGKTVTTEFACFDPSPTRNPWNSAHTPGGSSSGSAAAVAVGMCAGAIASQTGGSITRPASYCGVAGVKPTFGRVSRRGVTPVSFHLDHVGVMARSAADCAALMQVIAGDDPQDPGAKSHDGFSLDECLAHVATQKPPRLGLLRAFFFDAAEREVAELTESAIRQLRDAGAEVFEISLPEGFEQVHTMHRRIMAAEAADFHRATFGALREGYGPNMAGLLAEGFELSMADYQAALRHQNAFRQAVVRTLSNLDALITPATPTAAPAGLNSTGDPRFNSPWSFAGTPTVSIPIALVNTGLPISLQLIGPAWSEARLLATAIWCERKLEFQSQPLMPAESPTLNKD